MLAAETDRCDVITPAYRAMQAQLHADNPHYGIASLEYAPMVAVVIEHFGVDDLLDYGAGKGRLAQGLRQHCKRVLRYHPYDPAIDAWSSRPAPREMVACIDVLEHIEPELLDNVLDELASITTGTGFFSIHMGPAAKVLADGRNAHLIQKPSSWWLPRIARRFEVKHLQSHQMMGRGIWLLVEPRATTGD
jgi:hypothetical protein